MILFLINFVDILFEVLSLAILVRVLLSWVRVDPYNRFVQLLYQVTEPVLAPIRRIIPPIGMIDVTPIAALIILQILRQVFVSTLVAIF